MATSYSFGDFSRNTNRARSSRISRILLAVSASVMAVILYHSLTSSLDAGNKGCSTYTSDYPKGPYTGICDPEFPPHLMDNVTIEDLEYLNLTSKLDALLSNSSYDTGNYSIAIFGRTNTLYERHSKNTTNDSIYRIASITKAFTDLATLLLRRKHVLSLDDDIRRHVNLTLPQEFDQERVSLRSLGSHTSGFPGTIANIFKDIYWDKDGDTQMIPDDSACDDFQRMCSPEEFINQFESSFMTSIPNSFPEYFNEAFGLLAAALSSADPKGRSVEDIIIEDILTPLNMTSSFFKWSSKFDGREVYDSAGYFYKDLQGMNPAGGLYSSSHDMVKFIQGAMLGTSEILFPSELAEWLQPVVALPNGDQIGFPWETVSVSLGRRTTKVYTKGGSLGHLSLAFAIPEAGLGGIIMTAEIPNYASVAAEIANTLTQVGIQHLANLSEKYTGSYYGTNSHGNKFEITIETRAQSLYITSAKADDFDFIKDQGATVIGLQPTGYRNRFIAAKLSCLAWERRERLTSRHQGMDVFVWRDGEWYLPAFNTTLSKRTEITSKVSNNSPWVELGKKVVLPEPNGKL